MKLHRISQAWRILRWPLFAAVLAGLGWALHTWLPLEPRWTADGSFTWPVFLPDGTRVLTVGLDKLGYRGPVPVRELATGRECLRFGDNIESVLAHRTSDDFRRWMGVVRQRDNAGFHFLVADLESGAEHRTLLDLQGERLDLSHGQISDLQISPRGNWICAIIRKPGTSLTSNERSVLNEGSILLLQAETGQVQARLPWNDWPPHFTPGGDFLLHGHVDADGKTPLIGVWDTTTRQTVTTIAPETQATWLAPDGKTLQSTPVVARDGSRTVLWAVPSGERRQLANTESHWARFSNEGRLLAVMPAGNLPPDVADGSLAIYEVPVARKRGAIAVHHKAEPVFSNDGRRLLLLDEVDGRVRVRMIDTETVTSLWEIARPTYCPWIRFSPADDIVAIADWPKGRIDLIDAVTGQIQAQVPLGPIPDGMEFSPSGGLTFHGPMLDVSSRLAPDRNSPRPTRSWFMEWVAAWLQQARTEPEFHNLATIIDTRTGRVVFQSDSPTFGFAWLSPDGRFLLASTDVAGAEMQCYDVPERKPLRWVFGVPIGLGATLLAIRFGWRKLRAARTVPRSGPVSA